MHRELLTSSWHVGLLGLDLLVATCGLLLPLLRRYPDDRGDGRSLVLLPTPHPVSWLRTVRLVGVFVALVWLQNALAGSWSVDTLYSRAVQALAGTAIRAPTEIAGFSSGAIVGARFLVVATLIALAGAVSAPAARRLLILLSAVWYLAVMVCVDAVITVAAAVFGYLGPMSGLVGGFVALLIGMVALLRAIVANFALPGPTQVRRTATSRRRARSDSVVLGGSIVASVAVSAAVCFAVVAHFPTAQRTELQLFLPLPFAGLAVVLRTCLLHLVRWLRPRDPEPGEDDRGVDVIIPAFNEASGIADTLESIDLAARRYAGAVRVIVANDSSTDDTYVVSAAAIADFVAATGQVVTVRHGGKSATLNAALALTTAAVVIRIDADTLLHPDAIRYSMRWFQDPEIGQVEAMVIPRRSPSWFAKMRLFETLRTFGFVHRAYQVVGAVNVVPGMFTACRRDALVELGGFTVGMNGEDADLTLQMVRLGYRTWLDDKVVIYEDVPPTFAEFREQRIRWSRATIHAFARHNPFVLGPGSPAVWYSQLRLTLFRTLALMRLTGYAYLPLVVVFGGFYRYAVVIFAASWLAFTLASMLLVVALAARFGQLRRAGWVVFWIPFVVLRVMFAVEALLSLPARPVGRDQRARLDQRDLEPVVH